MDNIQHAILQKLQNTPVGVPEKHLIGQLEESFPLLSIIVAMRELFSQLKLCSFRLEAGKEVIIFHTNKEDSYEEVCERLTQLYEHRPLELSFGMGDILSDTYTNTELYARWVLEYFQAKEGDWVTPEIIFALYPPEQLGIVRRGKNAVWSRAIQLLKGRVGIYRDDVKQVWYMPHDPLSQSNDLKESGREGDMSSLNSDVSAGFSLVVEGLTFAKKVTSIVFSLMDGTSTAFSLTGNSILTKEISRKDWPSIAFSNIKLLEVRFDDGTSVEFEQKTGAVYSSIELTDYE